MAGDRIVHGRTAAAIGHMDELDARLLAQQHHGQMPDAAAADRRIGDLVRAAPSRPRAVGERVERARRMSRDNIGRGRDEQDRVEILLGVEGKTGQQGRIDRMGIEHDQPGIAVGRRFGHHRGAGAARRARPIFHDDVDAEALLQALLGKARHRIDRSARRERHDDPDRAGGPSLRLGRKRGSDRAEHHRTPGQHVIILSLRSCRTVQDTFARPAMYMTWAAGYP